MLPFRQIRPIRGKALPASLDKKECVFYNYDHLGLNSRKDNMMSELPPKIARPAQRALAQAGITSLEQLAGFTEAEIAELHGIGPNALKQLRQALAEKGLSFSD